MIERLQCFAFFSSKTFRGLSRPYSQVRIRVSLSGSRDPVSFWGYKFTEKYFPIPRFPGKSIIIFINSIFYLKPRIIQCFLCGAQWLNVSVHVLTTWSSRTPKSKPCGVSMRDCVCVTLRVVCTASTISLVATNIAVEWQRG